MPFRSTSLRELSRNRLNLKRRTGESSPSFYPEGYGKSRGSATELFRMALRVWIKEKFGTLDSPISFQYKLYRHRIADIVGTNPYIKHIPSYGNGKRGFVMSMKVISIDGIPVKMWPRRDTAQFALNRIVSYKKIFLLQTPPREIES